MAQGQGILNVRIKDKPALFAAYMPFVKNGGLFITTNKTYRLGDEVFMVIYLLDNPRMPVAGKVVWVTPMGASGNRLPGIGVQFSEQDHGNTRNVIESVLAGVSPGDRPTNTM